MNILDFPYETCTLGEELTMRRIFILGVAIVCAALSSCRTTVRMVTDGTLTEKSIIVISPDTTQMAGKAHAPAATQAFRGHVGGVKNAEFTVKRSQANDVYIATLVPDYEVVDNEIQHRFVPAKTQQLLFTRDGVEATPRQTSRLRRFLRR